jgi:hypothetical protein
MLHFGWRRFYRAADHQELGLSVRVHVLIKRDHVHPSAQLNGASRMIKWGLAVGEAE